MPAVAAVPLPTLSQIESMTTTHLSELADASEAETRLWVSAFSEAKRLVDEADWHGPAQDQASYRADTDRVLVVGAAEAPRNVATIARHGAEELRFAQQRVLNAVGIARDAGYIVGDDLSVTDPTKYTSFEQYVTRRDHGREYANDIRAHAANLVAVDRELAGKLTAASAGLRTASFSTGGGQHGGIQLVDNHSSDADGRRGRRLRSDEVFRRPEGGDRGDGNFSTDWAGRAILEHYLTGRGEWTITDDPNWTKYMQDNQLLRNELLTPTQTAAQDALAQYLAGGGASGKFEQTVHANIENGEGIVGYQYLHGTDSTVGDFRIAGDTVVQPQPDGTYKVTLNSGYTWNDKIDPNPIYATDQMKSRWAEIITLGKADPYDIHITWHDQSTVTMDNQGNVINVEGYPAP